MVKMTIPKKIYLLKKTFIILFLFVSIQSFAQKKDRGFLYAQELFEAKKYYEALYEFQSVKTYDQFEEDFKNKYIAKIYSLVENKKEALPYLEKLETEEKNYLLGKNLLERDRPDKAIFYLEKSRAEFPENELTYFYLGEAYFKQDDFEQAYTYYKSAKLLGFETEIINKNIGVCAYFYGNFLEAIVHLEQAKKYLEADVKLNNYLGMSYFNVARKDLAVQTLRKAINTNIKNKQTAELAVNLSLIFDNLEQSDSSIFYLKKAITIDEERVDALYFLGNKMYNLKMYRQSQDYYERLLAINPNFEKAYKQLANAYFQDNLYDKAIEKFRQSTFFETNSSEELNYIGICYLQANDIAKAKTYFEEALKVDPTFVQAYINLANLSFQEKSYDEAIGFLSYANQYKKNDPEINFLFAKVYLQSENLNDAAYYFKETIRFNPLKKQAYLYLGHLALLKNNSTEANFYYDILLSFKPDHFDANLYRGISSYLENNFEASIKYLNKAESLNAKNYKVRYQLAKAYVASKDYISAYEKLSKLNTENPSDKRIYYLLHKTTKALKIKDEAKLHKATIKSFEKI